MFTLKPLKEILAMSKEKLDETMAPILARKIKAKADLEVAKIDEKMASLEADIQKHCSTKDIDFDKIISHLDEHALNERRKVQFEKIVKELFPE